MSRRFCKQYSLLVYPEEARHPVENKHISSLSVAFLLFLSVLLRFFCLYSPSKMMKNGCPFTSAQWQELEHQFLIFKYMLIGSPIPTDLISSLRRSFDSSISPKLFHRHPIGWGCGRIADPEPGRCRRTDGKKWRCSKEAYPDSKYCERHMHRGKNRSRKLVEVSSTSSPSPPISSANNFSISIPATYSSSLSMTPSFSSAQTLSFYSHCRDPALHQLLSPPPNPPVTAFSSHSSIQNELLSGWSRDHRHDHGTRDGRDEQAFFPETSGMGGNLAEPCPPLTINSCHQSRRQNLDQNTKEQRQQEQHCFILGTDFQSSKQVIPDNETETQKPLHHFFHDWPVKKKESWLDLAFNSN